MCIKVLRCDAGDLQMSTMNALAVSNVHSGNAMRQNVTKFEISIQIII